MIPPSGVDRLPEEAAGAEQPPSPASTGSQESKVPRALPQEKQTLHLGPYLSTLVSSDLGRRGGWAETGPLSPPGFKDWSSLET